MISLRRRYHAVLRWALSTHAYAGVGPYRRDRWFKLCRFMPLFLAQWRMMGGGWSNARISWTVTVRGLWKI